MPNPMLNGERLEAVKLQAAFPDAIKKVKTFRGDTFICVEKDLIVDVLTLLRDDEELKYDYFSECVGLDYSTWTHERDLDGRFEVVYNLMSLKHYSRIFVKVACNDGESIPSAKEVFIGAEFPEREVSDLYGIVFTGNEPEGRFLLPDDWIGYPLRKEYPLGGEDVLFDGGDRGPAIEDKMVPHAGESFEGRTGSERTSGR